MLRLRNYTGHQAGRVRADNARQRHGRHPRPPGRAGPASPPRETSRSLDKIHADQVPYPAEKAANAWAIVTARELCHDIGRHHVTVGAEAEAFFKKFAEADGWTAEQALTLVTDAVTTYCPEVRNERP